ncbi:MAG: hypothetical protein HZA79_07075 [Sphingobacteriales bacterium]|nr:hypothetical protein [Sphingobacteriales bacterium]
MRPGFLLLSIFLSATLRAQKVDSIYFHLYTDSLKKGQHNYINVDGKLSNGRWLPMTTKEVEFSCSAARFEGNELVIPPDFKEEKVIVKAILKANRNLVIEKTIWIKTLPDPELPSRGQIMQSPAEKKQKNRRRQ